MKRKTTMLVGGCLAAATLLPSGGSAAAAQPYDPNVERIANPANACTSIPGSIERAAEIMGMPAPDLSWFDYSDCVTTLARGEAFVEPAEEFGDPYAQCDLLQSFGVEFPYTFHDGDSEEDLLLPDLTAKNRKQCGSALYAFHAIFTGLFPEGPPAE